MFSWNKLFKKYIARCKGFLRNCAGKELTFSRKDLTFSARPYFLVQGAIVLIIVFFFFNLSVNILPKFPKQITDSVIVTDTIARKVSATIVGQSVKWVVLVKRSSLDQGKYLIQLPKEAGNIKVKSVDDSQVRQILSLKPVQYLSNDERKKFVGIRSAESFLPDDPYSYLLANILDSAEQITDAITEIMTEPEEEDIIRTDEASFVDLSDQVIEQPVPVQEQVVEEQVPEQIIEDVPDILPIVEEGDILETASPSDQQVVDLPDVEPADPQAVVTPPEEQSEYVQIEYETPAPEITEQDTEEGKLVTVSSPEQEQQYTNVLAFTTIPEIFKVGEESKIKIKWQNNGNQDVQFNAYDLDNDGKLDYVEWTVPHLSDQIFEIIFISKAFRLDQDRNILEDIYEQVQTQDNSWVALENSQYVRVTFENILDNTRDITLYAKATIPGQAAIIEVYAENSDQLITTFESIDQENTYTVYLTNLQTPTDVFDLKIIGNIDIDYIVDPSYACQSNAVTGNWSAAGSWTNCNSTIPQTADTVEIMNGHTITLDVDSTVASVTIDSGGILTEDGTSHTLTVNGVWSNSGTFTAATSTVVLTTTMSFTGNTTFNNLTFNPTADPTTYTLTGTTQNVSGLLLFSGGANWLKIVGATTGLNAQGDITVTNTYAWPGGSGFPTGYLNINGSGEQTLTGGAAGTEGQGLLPYIRIAKTADTTLHLREIINVGANLPTTAVISYTTGVVDAVGSTVVINQTGRLVVSSPAVVFDDVIMKPLTNYNAVSLFVLSSFATSGNLTIDSGAYFSPGARPVTIGGSFICNGGFGASSSIPSGVHIFSGPFNIGPTGGADSYIGEFYASTNATATVVSGDAVVEGFLSAAGGGSAASVTFNGSANFTGATFTKGTGTIKFSKGSAQTFTPSSDDFGAVQISTASTAVTLGSALTATSLTIDASTSFDLGGKNLTFSSAAAVANSGNFKLKGTETLTSVNNLGTAAGTVIYYGNNAADPITIKDFSSPDYFNLTIDDENATKAAFSLGNALEVDGKFYLQSGLFTQNANNLNVAGDFELTSNATFTAGGTLTFDGTTQVITDSTSGQDLGTITIGPSTTTSVSTSTNTKLTALTIGADDTFDITGDTLTLTGIGTILTNNNTFTVASSTVIYTGTTANIAATTYNNLTLTPAGATTYTAAGALAVNGNLTINTGATLDIGSGNSYNIALTGNWINSGTFNPRTGTVTFAGGNQSISGSTIFHNFSKTDADDNSTDLTLTFDHTGTQTINGLFTLAGIDDNDRINLVSDEPGTYWTLTANGTFAINYVQVTDSDASSGNAVTFTNTIGADGHNLNWSFNSAPSISVAPSDGGSSAASQTKVGDDVSFTATAIDGESDDYYLAVCKTNSITANNLGAPTCGGGNWCVSSSIDSGSVAFCDHTTVAGDEGSKEWYAFVCDYNALSMCSSSSQGDSPFVVDATAPAGADISSITATSSTQLVVFSAATDTGSGLDDTPYYVAETTGNPGASSSGWQATTSFTDTGLNPSTLYAYEVRARDAAGNVSDYSSISSKYTLANTPSTPTLTASNSTTLGVVINENSNSSAATFSVKVGSQYVQANGTLGVSPVYQTKSVWVSPLTVSGLVPNTQYTVSINAKNGDDVTTDYSSTSSKYTLANAPASTDAAVDSAAQITVSWSANSNASGTEYYVENTTNSTNSGWTTASFWINSGLSCGTSYSFRVKARNGDAVDTDFSDTVSATTSSCGGGGLPGGAYAPPSAPTGGFSVLINNGDSSTENEEVTLILNAGSDTVRMAIANDSAFTNSVQESYQDAKIWKLSDGEGVKTVYVKFFNSWGQPSGVVSDTINLGRKKVVQQIVEAPVEAVKEVVKIPGEIIDGVGTIIEEIIGPKEEPKLDLPPAEEIVMEEAPSSMRNKWNIFPAKSFGKFVLGPIPKEFSDLAQKIPSLGKTFKEIDILRISDMGKLVGVNLVLPGLAETTSLPIADIGTGKLALPQGIPLDKLTVLAKAKIPTEVIFARTSNGLVDQNVSLYVNAQGELQQKIKMLSGKSLQLIVKPDKPVQGVKGYLALKQAGFSSNPFPQYLAASLISSQVQEDINNILLLQEFNYQDNDRDGIWTAGIFAPVAMGEYEIVTTINYKDINVESKEIRLITVVDPEGYIYAQSSEGQIRVNNAKVTLYWLNPETKLYELWPAKQYQQSNPQTTDVTGRYAFLVPEGSYYIKVEASGYVAYYSGEFEIKNGVEMHENIELLRNDWFAKYFDWKVLLLLLILVLLLLNFYRDTIRERIQAKTK
ncbi:MAG: hypothetical protein WC845_00200 [Candidatus Staskawiczbacteria bacterium]|jgi:hypothetical protein